LRWLRQISALRFVTSTLEVNHISLTCQSLGRTLLLLPIALSLVATEGCEKKSDSVVDSVGRPPVLLQTAVSPASINSDSINVGNTRSPDDLLSLSAIVTARVTASPDNPISIVHYALKDPISIQTVAAGDLLDDGAGVDKTRGDSLFTGKVGFQIKRVEVGTFRLEIRAESQNGFQSNTAVVPLIVFRGNRPPVLSALDAPDTLTLANQSQLLPLRIKASDPDGLSDVARVIFNSYKPDSSASSGNPFQMYDDGAASHGDVTAGDGTYSLIIALPSNTQLGTYRFEFQAFDRSNEASAKIVHRITVKQ
jgi:hypothetical protein